MRIISNEVEDCFDECESTYKEMLDEFNKAQKSDQEQIHYECLEFDYKEKNEIEAQYNDPLRAKEKSNDSKYLKYRQKHTVKGVLDLQWKRLNLGMNVT